VFLPLIAGFVLLFIPDKAKVLHKSLALIIAAVAFFVALQIFSSSDTLGYTRPVLELEMGNDIKLNIDLLLNTNPLKKFILLFAMGFGLLISLYSMKITSPAKQLNIYFGSLMMTIGGAAGIILADHLLLLLIFWEIVTVSLYLLITTGGENANFAATKSFAMIAVSDAAFLLGIAIIWVISQTFVISNMNIPTNSGLSIIAFLLLMLAAITKAGAMPLHTWIPESGQNAPASVMAILPAALDKLLGIYLLVIIVKQIFILQSPALTLILAIIGSATIIIAVMVAMVQHNVQKLLSYHAISQVGYMVLGIATLTPVGIAGGLFHMLNHAIYKCCLFLCGGAVKHATGTLEVEELGGLGNKMPWTFLACLIAALSISGIPPFNGFVSKWMVYQGVIEMGSAQTQTASAGLWPLWLLAAMFGSALTLASFVKIIHSIFLSRLPSDKKHVREAPASMLIPMAILALLCILFGVFYDIPLKAFIYPALDINPADITIFGTWYSTLATALLAVGIILGCLVIIISLWKRKVRIVPTWTCGETQPNDQMIIPGTHFYKTISSMSPFKQLYNTQQKGAYDPYNYGKIIGSAFTNFLKWLHSGLLPMYLTWVMIGLLIILIIICELVRF
jgi:formate hydrogenlyase subunit 3/multisubunit Na+/H+ antiporter MnhD subunit